MHLTVPHYGPEYYEQHKAAGLDYLGHGTWQEDYGRWLVDVFHLTGASVLDVGCACGSVALGLCKAGTHVDGIDLSEHMISLGCERFRHLDHPHILTLHVCDAVNLHSTRDGYYHFIHSAQSAEHWKPELVPFILKELNRVAAPGARFFCALDTSESFERQDRAAGRPGEDPTHVCIRPMRWWHRELREAGWVVTTGQWTAALQAHPLSFISPTGRHNYDWDYWVALRLPLSSELPLEP